MHIHRFLLIDPAQGPSHKSRQRIHRHTACCIGIKRGMSQPSENGLGPSMQTETRELIAVDFLKGGQNMTHFFFCLPLDDAVRTLSVHTPPKLPPHPFSSGKRFLEWDQIPNGGSHKTQTHLA